MRKSPPSRASSRDRREKAAGEPSDISLSPPLIDSPPSEPADDIVMPVREISDSLLAKIDTLTVQGDPEEVKDDDESVSKLSPPFVVAVADQQQEKSAALQECVIQAGK